MNLPKSLPVLAIVGRPNVGKSTLFNRFARRRAAIVDDRPGVTRDRNYTIANYNQYEFFLIDTGGFEPAADGIMEQMRQQSQLAIEEQGHHYSLQFPQRFSTNQCCG